jgi:hypothetical protein
MSKMLLTAGVEEDRQGKITQRDGLIPSYV